MNTDSMTYSSMNFHSEALNLTPREQEMMKLPTSFPTKLFNLLESADRSVVDWLPHGRAFRVNDNDKFVKEILPQYFKQTKFESFQRQLNIYGFRRVLKGPDHGAYYNPHFERGRIDLLSKIKRVAVSETPSPRSVHDIMSQRKPNQGHIPSLRGGPFKVTTTTPTSAMRPQTTNIVIPTASPFQSPRHTFSSRSTDTSGPIYSDSTSGDDMSSMSSIEDSTMYSPRCDTHTILDRHGKLVLTFETSLLSQYGDLYYVPPDGNTPLVISMNLSGHTPSIHVSQISPSHINIVKSPVSCTTTTSQTEKTDLSATTKEGTSTYHTPGTSSSFFPNNTSPLIAPTSNTIIKKEMLPDMENVYKKNVENNNCDSKIIYSDLLCGSSKSNMSPSHPVPEDESNAADDDYYNGYKFIQQEETTDKDNVGNTEETNYFHFADMVFSDFNL